MPFKRVRGAARSSPGPVSTRPSRPSCWTRSPPWPLRSRSASRPRSRPGPARRTGCGEPTWSVPIPPKAWETWQTPPDTVALIDSLLDDHTDAGVAEALNQAGHRSGKGQAFSPHMVEELRRRYELRNHYERLRAAGMLSIEEM